jgi:hypothetical protein
MKLPNAAIDWRDRVSCTSAYYPRMQIRDRLRYTKK